jgi:hypothetical protein
MATSAQTTPTQVPREEANIGGWAVFAAIVVGLASIFSGLDGVAAV